MADREAFIDALRTVDGFKLDEDGPLDSTFFEEVNRFATDCNVTDDQYQGLVTAMGKWYGVEKFERMLDQHWPEALPGRPQPCRAAMDTK